MRKSILISLALVLLLTQWSWLEHAYHDHDSSEVCDFCLIGNASDHAITAPVMPETVAMVNLVVISDGQPMPAVGTVGHTVIRAPPTLS